MEQVTKGEEQTANKTVSAQSSSEEPGEISSIPEPPTVTERNSVKPRSPNQEKKAGDSEGVRIAERKPVKVKRPAPRRSALNDNFVKINLKKGWRKKTKAKRFKGGNEFLRSRKRKFDETDAEGQGKQ